MPRPAVTCDTCELNTLAPPDRQELCRSLARESIRGWWYGTALRELDRVAHDEMSGQGLSDVEQEAILLCMAEHSSTRCANMDP